MKVVLLENIKGIGQKGEIKEVRDGYAMNFLLPQKKVTMATAGNAKQAELIQEKNKENIEKDIAEAESLAKNIEGREIIIQAKAQKGKLFGALTEKEIMDKLIAEKINLGTGKIKTTSKIKKIGDYNVIVTWMNNIQAKFKLTVKELN